MNGLTCIALLGYRILESDDVCRHYWTLRNLNKLMVNGPTPWPGKCSCLAICLRSTHTGDNVDYVSEFLWPRGRNYYIVLESLLLNLRRCLPSFKFASGQELGGELRVVDFQNSTGSDVGSFEVLKLEQGKVEKDDLKQQYQGSDVGSFEVLKLEQGKVEKDDLKQQHQDPFTNRLVHAEKVVEPPWIYSWLRHWRRDDDDDDVTKMLMIMMQMQSFRFILTYVANAAGNYEILHERDDDDAERPDKRQKSGDRHQPTTQQSSHRNHGHNNDRHGSDRRSGGDNHRSNNNYSGSNNRLNFKSIQSSSTHERDDYHCLYL
nr:hypothetical protein [Tanacetum cinerariifolium]